MMEEIKLKTAGLFSGLLFPANRTGKVLEWLIEPNRIDNWIREPQILYSQVGYHPDSKERK